jgi:ribosomal protein S18 acetylase RimI-like enzyme
MLQTPTTNTTTTISKSPDFIDVQLLTAKDEFEVLTFLSQRPIHTVTMKSLIRDNGLVSPLNRGNFYGCRDVNGHLEGVALVGHATLMETVSDRALHALAKVARDCPFTHMIMGEQERITDFWANYSEAGRNPRLACRELLLELQIPGSANQSVAGLRQATEDELNVVMMIQAQLAFDESGIDPMKADPKGFRRRCLRRIRQGRTWVLFQDDKLVFKADVISETREVVYLEGIWVADHKRKNGLGTRCMSALSAKLLSSAKSLCLLTNEVNTSALAFYRKCGFLFRATYETIFLSPQEALTN